MYTCLGTIFGMYHYETKLTVIIYLPYAYLYMHRNKCLKNRGPIEKYFGRKLCIFWPEDSEIKNRDLWFKKKRN